MRPANDVNLALITFGSSTTEQFPLWGYANKTAMYTKINGIVSSASSRLLAPALAQAGYSMRRDRSQDPIPAPKRVFYFTSAMADDGASDLSKAVQNIKLDGIELFVVAFGTLNTNYQSQVTNMASSPLAPHFLNIPSGRDNISPEMLGTILRRMRGDPGEVCMSFGLGHIQTFDGSYYTFPAYGDFYLVKSEAFSIMQRQVRCTTTLSGAISTNGQAKMDLPCTRGFAIWNGLTEIYELHYDPITDLLSVFLNKQEVTSGSWQTAEGTTLAVKRRLPGGYKVTLTSISQGFNLKFNFDPVTSSVVIFHFRAYGSAGGLCGSYDGNATNDFVTPNGTMIPPFASLTSKFYWGHNWQVPTHESLFYRDVDLYPIDTVTSRQNLPQTPIVNLTDNAAGAHPAELPHFPLEPRMPKQWKPFLEYFPAASTLAIQTCGELGVNFMREACRFDVTMGGGLPFSNSVFDILIDQCDVYCASGVMPIAKLPPEICANYCPYKFDQNLIDNIAQLHQTSPMTPPVTFYDKTRPDTFFNTPLGLGGKYLLELSSKVKTHCSTTGCPVHRAEVNIACKDVAPTITFLTLPIVYPVASVMPEYLSLNIYPIVELNVSVTISSWYSRLGVRPTVDWKMLAAVTPKGAAITPLPTIVAQQRAKGAYFQPTVPGTYVLEIAAHDGCAISKRTVNVTVACPVIPSIVYAGVQSPTYRPMNYDSFVQRVIQPRQAQFLPGTVVTQSWELTTVPQYPVKAGYTLEQTVTTTATSHQILSKQTKPLETLWNDTQTVYNQTVSDKAPNLSATHRTTQAVNAAPWPWNQYTPQPSGAHLSYGAEKIRVIKETTQTVKTEIFVPAVTEDICTARITWPGAFTTPSVSRPAIPTYPPTQIEPTDISGTISLTNPASYSDPEWPFIKNNCPGTYTARTVIDTATGCSLSSTTSWTTSCGPAPIMKTYCADCHQSGTVVYYDYYPTLSFGAHLLDASESYDPAVPARTLVWRWTLVNKPSASKIDTKLCDWTTAACTSSLNFRPDVPGAYAIQVEASTGCAKSADIFNIVAACLGGATAVLNPEAHIPSNDTADYILLTSKGSTSLGQIPPQFRTFNITSWPNIPEVYKPYISDPTWTMESNANQTIRITPKYPGDYTVRLNITDGCAVSETTRVVTVTCDPSSFTLNVVGNLTSDWNAAGTGVFLAWNVTALIVTDYQTKPIVPQYRSWAVWVSKPDGANPTLATTQQSSSGGTALHLYQPVPDLSGTYVLRIIATDGCNWSYRDVTLYANCPPTTITALGFRPIISTTNYSVSLDGNIGSTWTGAATVTWKWNNTRWPAGASQLTFTSPNALVTNAAISFIGAYDIELSAYDCPGRIQRTSQTLTFNCIGTAPTPGVDPSVTPTSISIKTKLPITLNGTETGLVPGASVKWNLTEYPNVDAYDASKTLYWKGVLTNPNQLKATFNTDPTTGILPGGVYRFTLTLDSCWKSQTTLTITKRCPAPTITARVGTTSWADGRFTQVLLDGFGSNLDPSGDGIVETDYRAYWIWLEAPTYSIYAPQKYFVNTTKTDTTTVDTKTYTANTTKVTTVTKIVDVEERLHYYTQRVAPYDARMQNTPFRSCFTPDRAGVYRVGLVVLHTDTLGCDNINVWNEPKDTKLVTAVAPAINPTFNPPATIVLPNVNSQELTWTQLSFTLETASPRAVQKWEVLSSPDATQYQLRSGTNNVHLPTAWLGVRIPGSYNMRLTVADQGSVFIRDFTIVATCQACALVTSTYEQVNLAFTGEVPPTANWIRLTPRITQTPDFPVEWRLSLFTPNVPTSPIPGPTPIPTPSPPPEQTPTFIDPLNRRSRTFYDDGSFWTALWVPLGIIILVLLAVIVLIIICCCCCRERLAQIPCCRCCCPGAGGEDVKPVPRQALTGNALVAQTPAGSPRSPGS